MNPEDLNPSFATITPVDAEEPGLVLPLLSLTIERKEVWC